MSEESLVQTIVNMILPLWSALVFLLGCWALLPLGLWFFPRLKSPDTAAMFHALFGLIFCILLYKWDTLILLAGIVIGYFSITLPPLYGSVIGFSMSSFSHVLYAIRNRGWAIDISGNFMCLFQKVTSLAFNLDDGRKKKNGQEIRRKRWVDVALDEKPSFIRFVAYCLTPFGSFGNPFIEYKVFEYALHAGERGPISPEEKKLALNRYLWSFVYAIFNLFAMTYIGESVYDSPFYVNAFLPVKIGIIVVCQLIQLSRYFTTWYTVEAGYIALGLNNNEFVPADELQNCQFSFVIQSPSCQEWMRRWNHTTHLFWKNYLYTRLLSIGWGQFFADMSVFAVSSAWHGFRPVFYLMIPETVAIMNADKKLITKFPLDEKSSQLKKLLYNAWTLIMMTYASSTFFYPSASRFLSLRNSIYWTPLIFAVIVFVAASLAPRKKPVPKDKKE